MKHLFKVPFILFWFSFTCFLFSKFGVLQAGSEAYVMDVEHILMYSSIVGFMVYGFYASLRDVLVLLYRESIKNYVRNTIKNIKSNTKNNEQ